MICSILSPMSKGMGVSILLNELLNSDFDMVFDLSRADLAALAAEQENEIKSAPPVKNRAF